MPPARPVKHTVLVVDDEVAVVESVQDLLRRDYRVLGATSAAAGMEILSREEVQVVMTDQRMPGMSGVEFLNRLRGAHPDAIRLIFTGYADMRAVIDAINLGNVYRYVTKPWDPDELEAVIRDAAERYDLIVERKRLLVDLSRTNEDLERINGELEQASALKTAFIRVASHELRAPLVVLCGLTELALMDSPSEKHAGYLKRIEGASQRLRRSIDQITNMLALGELKPRLERRPTDVASLLSQAADDVRPFVTLRGQRLELDLQGELGLADVDPGKTRDCLDHVLLNAIKFTPDGRAILVSAERKNGHVVLRVRDEGVGIDPTSLSRVFEPFFTGFDTLHHSSGTYEFGKKGLGLGLTIARLFVEMQGGRIDVDSRVGEGTTLTITLPGHVGPAS
jgi:signal transduction histidine kinase